jgi:tRNA threonylcarbamoyl adenosine modification protein (Sua5/YciO/YrdC/YwlC family)
MLLRINPDNILTEDIYRAVDALKNNGVIIYPTDSVYAMGCSLHSPKGIEKLARIKKTEPEKVNFTLICSDLSHLSDYTKAIPNTVFRIMKKALPGPYTFILPASGEVPKLFLKQNKKTVGIRVPDNAICREIVKILGSPLVSTSLHNQEDELVDYFTEPDNIYLYFQQIADVVIDGGYGNINPTTVIDCTGDEPEVTREGLGPLTVFD